MRKTTILVFIFILGLLTFAAGCGRDRPPESNVGLEERRDRPAVVTNTPLITAPATAPGIVTVADITSNWSNYAGKTVVVNGWVERAYGGNAFRLDEDSVFTGGVDNDLLVVGANGVFPTGLKFGDADSKVRVTGTVRRFVAADIERDYGFDLIPDVETEFKDKAVLVANSVQVIKRDE